MILSTNSPLHLWRGARGEVAGASAEQMARGEVGGASAEQMARGVKSSILALFVCILLTILLLPPVHAKSPQKMVFPNGFRLIVKEEPGRGLVAVTAIIRSGSLEEEGKPGIGLVLSRLMLTGAKNISQSKLQQLVDDVGGSFAVTWDPDYLEIYVSTTSDQMTTAVQLLSETLLFPAFDEKLLEESKRALVDENNSGDEAAFRKSYDQLRKLLYTRSPYRQPLFGTDQQINAITLDDLKAHTSKWFVPSNMVLAIVGDINPKQAEDSAKLWFGKQKPTAAIQRTPVLSEPGPTTQPKIIEMDSGATYFMAGTLAGGLSSPYYASDMVVATVLGGGKASRMFQEIRERQGLAYELGTLFPPLLYQSHIVAYVVSSPYVSGSAIYSSSQTPSSELIRSALNATVQSLKDRPITQQELDRARNYLVGTFALRHERLQERAKHLAWFEAMGLGYIYDETFADMIKEVTLPQVHDSARRLFNRSAMVVVIPTE